VVERLVRQGFAVAAHGRNEEKLSALAGVTTFQSDLTAPGAAATLIEEAHAALGGLDGVIHCAGVGLIKPSGETTDAEFSRIMNVNTRVTFLVAQAACKKMAENKKGLFVTIPGVLGRAVMKNAAAYVASKFAVSGLIKVFAQEYQRSGIRFSLLYLGGVDSSFWDGIGMNVQRDKMIPVGTAADLVMQAVTAPGHLVLSEVVMQPESHQLI